MGIFTIYAARFRLYEEGYATLDCDNQNDRFTVNDTTIGNGALTYPIGLISVDEASMAGLVAETENTSNYLYNNLDYWVFTPSYMTDEGYPDVFIIRDYGGINNTGIGAEINVRPVISIDSRIYVTGW